MNIAVAQSGGPTVAINASLLGVIKEGISQDSVDLIFGSINGIEGIIGDNLVNLNEAVKTKEDMELLKRTPSTCLGSCRYKLPDAETDKTVYGKIFDCFSRHNIGAFFYIGGNDSMDTVAKLSEYAKENGKGVKIIGIPKTIDNDLEYTDHTPGFGSAAKYVASTLKEISCDSAVYSIDSVTVVEIMGRHAGWLTASTCVLHDGDNTSPHLIYLPETSLSEAKFLADVREAQKKHRAVIVAVSEGLKLERKNSDKTYGTGIVDEFGHENLSGIGKVLENIIRREIGCKVRSIELNVMQRCSSHIASKTDIDEAEEIGREAVKEAIKGSTGEVMIFKRISSNPYVIKIEKTDAKKIANKEKFFPTKWITKDGNNVKEEAKDYFLPLIKGEQSLYMKDGLPVHFKIKK